MAVYTHFWFWFILIGIALLIAWIVSYASKRQMEWWDWLLVIAGFLLVFLGLFLWLSSHHHSKEYYSATQGIDVKQHLRENPSLLPSDVVYGADNCASDYYSTCSPATQVMSSLAQQQSQTEPLSTSATTTTSATMPQYNNTEYNTYNAEYNTEYNSLSSSSLSGLSTNMVEPTIKQNMIPTTTQSTTTTQTIISEDNIMAEPGLISQPDFSSS